MKPVRVCKLRRFDTFLVGSVQLAVADIIHNCSGKQMSVLENHSQRPPQIRFFDLVDIDSVVADLAVGDVVEAVDQVGDSGFARSGGSHESDLLAGFRIKADVVEHDLVFVIAEIHIVKYNAAFLSGIGDGSLSLMRMLPGPQIRSHRRFGEVSVLVLHCVDKFHIAVVRFAVSDP